MKKQTLISKLRSEAKLRQELTGVDLVLVLGGIKTITQDSNGKAIVVDGDTIET
ncbi:MAG TPA: hypothetical protein VJ725_27170 [Thermoanaerobaculia bacterium]|nr:hypothetical protein [Thermoanaerobaculia bacterium]